MYIWFECKVRYEKVVENGMTKKITEPYVVDALSFTEAENRMIEIISQYVSGEFTISDIKRVNYSEVFFNEDGDRWFKAKLQFISIDEKSGAEKRSSTNMLVQASDIRDALDKIDAGMKGTMSDYIVAAISETAIMEVYPYESRDNDKPEYEGK